MTPPAQVAPGSHTSAALRAPPAMLLERNPWFVSVIGIPLATVCSALTYGEENDIRVTTLDAALQQFDATEANLGKLEKLWKQISELLPTAPAFGSPPEYQELCLAFRRVLPGLPAIGGMRIADHLPDYDDVGQMYLDALEVGDIEAQVAVGKFLDEQGNQLQEYRFRFQAKRRELVRDRLHTLVNEIDTLLNNLSPLIDGAQVNVRVTHPLWNGVKEAIDEIDTLLGSATRPGRWHDLRRHIHFGMIGDLSDIVKLDWPTVQRSLRAALYGDHDPVPVATEDLSEVVAQRPVGSASTRLDWTALNDEDFERLMFQLISEASEYENTQWLQRTHAPDRGRDLSTYRIGCDSLAGVRRYRTIIQCKHWLSTSVGPAEIGKARNQMELWQPPRVDVLVVATTGRFTTDAVSLVEQHNQSDKALHIEMWPDSHLERLLAAKPHLVGQFGLRCES